MPKMPGFLDPTKHKRAGTQGVNCQTQIACPQVHGKCTCFRTLGLLWNSVAWTLFSGWSVINVDLLLQEPFGYRHDIYAPFYLAEIVTLGQARISIDSLWTSYIR